MKFTFAYTKLIWGRLCRQRGLLAGLVLLCLLLPLGAGQAAQVLLSQGVEFDCVTLAITAPPGDRTPWLLEQYMGNMEDVAQYCRFAAMEEEAAQAALHTGEVTAVLALPEHFIRGVMWGENPDLRLIVAADRPLESLLLLWVGQSACDMLSAFQSGVYAVLELYEQTPPSGLSRDQVVADINLNYIRLALDRGDLFCIEKVSATQTLPIPLHYALALLVCFAMAFAPLFVPIYSGNWLAFQRRLRCVGCGGGYLGSVLAGTGILFLLTAPALAAMGGEKPLFCLGSAVGIALWCSLFCGLCCLAAQGAAPCGTAAFTLALVFLALAGGIVPPVLLPAGVRAMGWLSPVRWLMDLAAWPMGYGMPFLSLACLGLTGAGVAAVSLCLYRRRTETEENP